MSTRLKITHLKAEPLKLLTTERGGSWANANLRRSTQLISDHLKQVSRALSDHVISGVTHSSLISNLSSLQRQTFYAPLSDIRRFDRIPGGFKITVFDAAESAFLTEEAPQALQAINAFVGYGLDFEKRTKSEGKERVDSETESISSYSF